nr:uncharacterized protein LOC119183564 [Rhipicephalus microplus]
MFSESQCATYCKVLARGVLIKEGPVHTKTEAEDELRKTDRMQLCAGAMRLEDYDEALFTTKLRDHVLTRQGLYFSRKCLGQVPKEGTPCVSCRYLRRALLTRRSRVQRRNTKARLNIAQKFKTAVRRNKRLSTRLSDTRESLAKLQQQAAAKNADVLQEQIGSLPTHQQEAVKHCFAAAKVKPNGLRYSKSWLLDCIIMKMKGPRLWRRNCFKGPRLCEHLRKNKILALPSKSTLKRYVSVYRTLFGFNEKILKKLNSKTAELDVSKRHGGSLIDKLKLSESLSVRSSGTIEGFVDLGPFTTQKDKSTPSDHGMVVLFVPFQGKWSQVIGCFATNGNMKADILAKVVVEATILAEKSGLFVDFITTDGASWNRKMWRMMGIHATASSIKCKVQHPSDPKRHLFFNSDFPHLIKCLRNSLLKSGFNTPAGHVSIRPVREAYKIDANNVTLKAMPGITECHLNPNGFEKMRVSIAFQLFGARVLQAFHLYRNELDKIFGTINATQEFFR